MSNALFDKGREGILDRTIDMTGDVRVMLIESSYVFDAADEFLSDLGSVDNGRSATLGSHTYTGGVFGAADTTITATSAVECGAIVIFQHTGNDSTARLVAFIDTPASGLPFTPAAGQLININWDTGPNKIFKL